VKKKTILLVASLAMLLVATASALAQTESGDEFRCLLPEGCGPGDVGDEFRCLLPEGCGPGDVGEVRCMIPEGCDTDGDGVPDLAAGGLMAVEGTGTGAVQYSNSA
jgi:hypothetical protein